MLRCMVYRLRRYFRRGRFWNVPVVVEVEPSWRDRLVYSSFLVPRPMRPGTVAALPRSRNVVTNWRARSLNLSSDR